jgi:hypothetical protein
MTLMSVAERRTPCSDGPLYGVGSGVAGGAVARDGTKGRVEVCEIVLPKWTIEFAMGNCV